MVPLHRLHLVTPAVRVVMIAAAAIAAAVDAVAVVADAGAAAAVVAAHPRKAAPAIRADTVRRAAAVAVLMEPTATTRADKWLWSVRLFKTRTLATEACEAGRVQVNGQPAKPARAVRPGDTIIAVVHDLTRTVKVLAILEKRIGAKLVPTYLEDLTPPAEFEKAREKFLASAGQRDKGGGRPTKRDRRILSSFFGEEAGT